MTNHLHLLVTPDRPGAVSNLMKDVAQRYTQHCNRTWKRTGPLWEGRFHSCIVDSETYLLRCHRYIEMNPVRAKMVGHPAEWRWSSHRSNALGMPSPILTPHAVFTALAADEADRRIAYREWFDLPESPLALELIRQAVRGGFALGPDDFIARLEAQLGKRAKRARRRSAASEVGQLSGLTPV